MKNLFNAENTAANRTLSSENNPINEPDHVVEQATDRKNLVGIFVAEKTASHNWLDTETY